MKANCWNFYIFIYLLSVCEFCKISTNFNKVSFFSNLDLRKNLLISNKF